jgi:hypothetical protein
MKRALLAGALLAALAAVAARGVVADSWRPNYRIGPVLFNYPLGDDVQVLSRQAGGRFAVRPRGGGPVVRGLLFPDPNTGRTGARAVWTESRELSFHGVRVGIPWRTARDHLPGRWRVRRLRGCGFLYSSRLRRDRTGPVSTQVYFRRDSGRVFRIALNEITEIGCPGG